MVCCPQSTSHYLNQYKFRSLSPYSVTRPQWFKVHAKWMVLTTTISNALSWKKCLGYIMYCIEDWSRWAIYSKWIYEFRYLLDTKHMSSRFWNLTGIISPAHKWVTEPHWVKHLAHHANFVSCNKHTTYCGLSVQLVFLLSFANSWA